MPKAKNHTRGVMSGLLFTHTLIFEAVRHSRGTTQPRPSAAAPSSAAAAAPSSAGAPVPARPNRADVIKEQPRIQTVVNPTFNAGELQVTGGTRSTESKPASASSPQSVASTGKQICQYVNPAGRTCKNMAEGRLNMYCKHHKCALCGGAKTSKEQICSTCSSA